MTNLRKGHVSMVRWISAFVGALAVALAGVQAYASSGGDHSGFLGVWTPDSAPNQLLTIEGNPPPLTEDGAALYDERRAQWAAGDLSFDRATWCAGPGMPRMMFMPYAFEIKESGDYMAFIYGWYRWHRVIDMAGGEPEVPFPITMGFATGNWEGDMLVIRTVGLSDVTILDNEGLPHSDDLVLTEHLRILPDGRLEDRMTIEDPAYFERPWETTMTYHRSPGTMVRDDVCPDRIARGEPAVKEAHP